MGAAMPICSYVGSRPISVVAAPMPNRVITRVTLRPNRSPMCPATMAPSGRNRKLMPRDAQETTCASCAFSAPRGLKKWAARMKAAACA